MSQFQLGADWEDVYGKEIDYSIPTVAEGEYEGTITNAEPHTSKDGKLSVKVEVNFPDIDQVITDYLSLTSNATSVKVKNNSFKDALGMAMFRVPRPNADGIIEEFIGRRVTCELRAQERNGISEMKISAYKPA